MNPFLAEFLGTTFFLYVIIATGAAIPAGAALAAMILVFGPYSGGYFNPAVSLMMAAAGKLPAANLLPYVLAECAGGLVALELHRRIKF